MLNKVKLDKDPIDKFIMKNTGMNVIDLDSEQEHNSAKKYV